jgi:hypothetical protein
MTCRLKRDDELTFSNDTSAVLPPSNACKSVIISLHLKHLNVVQRSRRNSDTTVGRTYEEQGTATTY